MIITQQDTYDTLKYGYIKPLTLMHELEEIVPNITRNFTYHYDNDLKQALYDKNHKHPSIGEPDGTIYKKEIKSRLSGNKPFYIGYQFLFLLSDKDKNHNNIIMRTMPSGSLYNHVEYKSNKKSEVISKQHFFDLICDWQYFVDDRIDKIITNVHETINNPNIGLKVRNYYEPPNSDPTLEDIMSSNTLLWEYDVDQFILKLNENRDIIKSFGS